MGVLTFLIVVSAATTLLASRYLTTLILLPNIVGGVLLPIILILTLRLINNKRLMGEYANSRLYNAIAWTTTITLVVLSLTLLITSVRSYW